jgi:hypothetical protein
MYHLFSYLKNLQYDLVRTKQFFYCPYKTQLSLLNTVPTNKNCVPPEQNFLSRLNLFEDGHNLTDSADFLILFAVRSDCFFMI